MTKHIQWDGTLSQEGYDILKGEGGCSTTQPRN